MEASKKIKNIRWGILGCGDVAEVKSGPAYQMTEGFELVAVMRRDKEKARDFAMRHGVKKYFGDADELINDNEVDAVYIATPPDSHLQYARKVADAGKPCCIEKPLSPSYKESLAINKAFDDKNLPLFVAYYRRSLPRFLQVKTWLDKGMIGQVRHVSWSLCKQPNYLDISGDYNWRTDPKVAPGGYFDDLASHGLDLFNFLFGNIKEVSGFSSNQQQLYPAKDAVAASWIHHNGVTGTGVWNFGCGIDEDTVSISGSKGKIEFSIFDNVPLILKSPGTFHEVLIENPVNIQIHFVEHMRDQLLKGNFIHPSNGKTALHTSWVMDKILGTI